MQGSFGATCCGELKPLVDNVLAIQQGRRQRAQCPLSTTYVRRREDTWRGPPPIELPPCSGQATGKSAPRVRGIAPRADDGSRGARIAQVSAQVVAREETTTVDDQDHRSSGGLLHGSVRMWRRRTGQHQGQ